MRPKIDTLSLLANLPLFREVARAELAPLAAATTVRHVPRGEIVFQRGDACDGFHIVVYGQIKLSFLADDGCEKVVEIVSAGTSFGESPMFLGSPYLMMAQGLVDSLLLFVHRNAVMAAIEHDPKFTLKLLAGMSNRMHRLINDVEAYSMHTGTERLVAYLLQQPVEAQGEPPVRVVTLPTSKAVIASRLNVTPEHLSRILHELAGSGLIEVAGRRVTIVDQARLHAYRDAKRQAAA